MRSFIGVDFSPKLKRQIADLQSVLRNYTVSGRWKYVDNFHLTLKFLGEVSTGQMAQIGGRLEIVAAAVGGFRLSLSQLGFFPGREDIRVLWLGLEGDLQSLHLLQQKVESSMADAGFPREQRRYQPHITIGQDLVITKKPEELKALVDLEVLEPVPVEKLVLFQSEQIKGKRIYTPVCEYSLKGQG
jgi:RNA 2',3'-cyclic 3'-phosphodiesterase